MEMLKTNKQEQITVACYKSWKFQRSVIIRGEWPAEDWGKESFFRKMTSEDRPQKFRSDDVPLPRVVGSASDGLKQIFNKLNPEFCSKPCIMLCSSIAEF